MAQLRIVLLISIQNHRLLKLFLAAPVMSTLQQICARLDAKKIRKYTDWRNKFRGHLVTRIRYTK
jgi:hypothetical protein